MSRPERDTPREAGRPLRLAASPLPSPPQRIVLAGFMGSGKTTVGRLLAERLGWSFADLDHAIETRQRRSIAAIFAASGEAAFRELEAQVLSELLAGQHQVLALGGGAPGSAPVRQLLRDTPGTAVVHLDAPFPLLYARCIAQRDDPAAAVRPLLGEEASARARYALRQPIYAGIAHHTAPAHLSSAQEVADSIAAALMPMTGT